MTARTAIASANTLRRQLSASESGIAATEFALLLPVMFALFFGMLEVSDVTTANRRVAIAVNTIADLAAQSEELTHDDVSDLIAGALAILDPGNTTTVNVNVISVILNDEDDPVVHWSLNDQGDEPYSADDPFTSLNDNAVLRSQGSLIVVEITYPYAPPFTQYFVDDPIVFTKKSIRWPRLVNRVQLCDNSNNCTT